ncbi:MAG TPA: class I SAM-dependent methyltransferase [Cytophagaceae bacterium]|jgi:caffeoyl-CoA O-methyltransferase|nr:class I SAM-dependent methyltransferase [Cytophagaceae bacterium]
MEFISQDIENYAELHTQDESALLKRISRNTYANVLMPRMLSGKLQGRMLAAISQMIRPNRILEIGTFTGYSALCLAEGLAEGGKLITIDINEELEEMVRGFIKESDMESSIDYRIGNALTFIPAIEEQFDLVFIDADKINYTNYYKLVFDKVKKGGFILVDNVLWSGKILLQDGKKADKDTQALIDFNTLVHRDERVENVLLPIRDGLMILRKK